VEADSHLRCKIEESQSPRIWVRVRSNKLAKESLEGLRTGFGYFALLALLTDLEITGAITADLFVKSSTVDTDFTAKLVDVWPDGIRARSHGTHPSHALSGCRGTKIEM